MVQLELSEFSFNSVLSVLDASSVETEDEKWDRIYHAKFEDKSYYTRCRAPVESSPLSTLIREYSEVKFQRTKKVSHS